MKERNKINYLLLIIVVLILIAINLYIFINNYFKKDEEIGKDNNIINTNLNSVEINTNYATVSEEEDEENRVNKIATLTEKQRMQTYFGQYISYVESKNYEKAYNLLYDGFKQNYFKTLEEFKSYAENKYPNNIVVEYTDIQRQGTLFIITVKIKDALDSIDQEGVKEQQVVIIENSINDFKLSFDIQQ